MHTSPVYMRETQKNRVTPHNGQSHHLKYRLRLKTKERGWMGREDSYGNYMESHLEKHTKQE